MSAGDKRVRSGVAFTLLAGRLTFEPSATNNFSQRAAIIGVVSTFGETSRREGAPKVQMARSDIPFAAWGSCAGR